MSRSQDEEFVTFTEDMLIIDALAHGPEVRDLFRKFGLKCVEREQGLGTQYCIAAEKEKLSVAGLYHDQDIRAILNQLNSLRVRPLTAEEREKGGR